MPRRWEREDWRKLYSRVDARWLALPLLTRGLGSELLKYAERPSGTIAVHEGESAEDAVIRLLAAHRSEVGAVRKAVKQLIDDGYLVVADGAISIKNFEAAQARSSNAERQARFRGMRREPGVTSNAVNNATDGVTVDEQALLRSDGSRDRALPGACTLTTSSLSGSSSGSPDQEDVAVTASPSRPTLGEAILAELQQHPVFGPIAIPEIADALALTAFDRKRSPEEAAACVREAGLKQTSRAAVSGAPTLDKLIDWVQACIFTGSRGAAANGARRSPPATDVQRGGWSVQSVVDGTDPETARANEARAATRVRREEELKRVNAERRSRGEEEVEELGW